MTDDLERRLGYLFRNRRLLEQALTHASFANEAAGGGPDYERLELLGDSVLGLLLTERLFTAFPDLPVGELTVRRARVVRNSSLAGMAKRLGLGSHLRLGAGAQKEDAGLPTSLLAGAFEAVLGALYIDGGAEAAGSFLDRCLIEAGGLETATSGPQDAKTILQEKLQVSGGEPPLYRLIATEGPPHRPRFTVEVSRGGKILATGQGPSRRAAEQNAARIALDALAG